jgi:excisionase family DNA binding protein
MEPEVVLLKIPEVMRRLGCGRNKVYELISSGDLRSVKFGGCRRVPSDELERFVADLETDPPTSGLAPSAGPQPSIQCALSTPQRAQLMS